MTLRAARRIGAGLLCLFVMAAVLVSGQAPPIPSGGAFGPAIVNIPFSAEATTTVRQRLADSRVVEHTAKARYFRDSSGRVRVEQMIRGTNQPRIMIWPDITTNQVIVFNPEAGVWHNESRWFADQIVGGGYTFSWPLRSARFLLFHRGDYALARYRLDENAVREESLGTQRIGDTQTMGRRIVTTVPADRVENPQPYQIVDERWESPELQLLLYARHSDPHSADIEYRITRLSRAVPASHLFEVPQTLSDRSPSLELVFAESPMNAELLRAELQARR